MNRLFIIPVGPDDGDPAYPIPTSSYVLEINNLAFANLIPPAGSQVALCLTKEIDPLGLLLADPELLIRSFEDIGCLATVVDIDFAENCAFVMVDVTQRIYTNAFSYDETINSSTPVLFLTEIEFVNEDFTKDEQSVLENVKTLFSLIVAHKNLFGDDLLTKLNKNHSPTQQMNILANSILKMDVSRLDYILSKIKRSKSRFY